MVGGFLYSILFFGFTNGVSAVVVQKHCIYYGNIYTLVVDILGNCFIIISGILHNGLDIAGQGLHSL